MHHDHFQAAPHPVQTSVLDHLRGYGIKRKTLSALRWPGRSALGLQRRVWGKTRAELCRLALHRPEVALRLMPVLRGVMPDRLSVAQAEALLVARIAGWEAAAPLFRRIPQRHLIGKPALRLLAPPPEARSETFIRPVERHSANLAPDVARKIVVYTFCFGAAPQLPPLFGAPEGVRFLCFTDQALTAPGWERIEAQPGEAPALRLCPHDALRKVAPEAEWSLFMAPDRLAVGNYHTLFTRWLLPENFALWPHQHCADWHDLAERHVLTGSADVAAVLAEAAACDDLHLPRGGTACDIGVIWRKHADAEVAAFSERWLSELHCPGAEDIALHRMLHGPDAPALRPAFMPPDLGLSEDNIFFARDQRMRRQPSPLLRMGRIPVTFLFAEERRNAGITLLRGRQLSEMISARFPDLYDVTFTSDTESVRDQVVIVNRGAIEFNDPRTLDRLRRRNILQISDWLDLPVNPRMNHLFDAHMALSFGQAVALNRRFPGTPAFHVTHHVNPDVIPATPPEDRLRSVYLGRPTNTTRPEALRDRIDMVDVIDVRFTAQHWREVVPHYNCHWIVRKVEDAAAFKPFLKGFVAARCGAVLIVTRDDANAMHYLGDDYPFYAENLDDAELTRTWQHVSDSFQGPEWIKAQDIMRQVAARSSNEQVCLEFKAMLDELLA